MKQEDLDNYIEKESKRMSDRELQEEIYKTLVWQGRSARKRERMLMWIFFSAASTFGILLYNFPPPCLR